MYVYEAENFRINDGVSMCGNYRENKQLLNWLASFRMNGFAPDRIGTTPYRKLSPYEEKIVKRDLLFLEKMPGDVIMEGDMDYPESLKKFLGSKCPKALFYMGEKSIIEQPSIMVCGAREASETGREIARKCGILIAEQGYVVASGYARGIDRAAHLGALEAGGNTMAALPHGLSLFRVRRSLIDAFDPGRFCAVSEVPPSYGFSVISAFRRNKLLAALAEAVIVIEPGDSGGTWYSAERARRMKRPLFYFEGSRPEIIRRMVPLGGIRLRMCGDFPDLSPVFEQCKR